MAEKELTPSALLNDLARNLRWDWHGPTRSFFQELDPALWEKVGHNPVALLRRLEPARMEGSDLESRARALWRDLHDYLADESSWYGPSDEPLDRPLTAYFSAEYGLTECLHTYAGGLGILAGDHLKSASDLGVPLVAVGLLYREGYFEQSIAGSGRQRESFPPADFADLPLRPVERSDGGSLRVQIPFPGRRVAARVWRADVGRVPLFLLDTDVEGNSDSDRRITSRLYGGDQETRIEQEIVLGIGGYRALRDLGIRPRSLHLNEGHSAFVALELARDIMEVEGLDVDDALAVARRRTVFTTHTPVPAGHDRFERPLMVHYFTHTARALGLPLDDLLALGHEDPARADSAFTMTVLALRQADQANAVSRLHGQVSREMWQGLWPDISRDDVPIDHVTNGVHLPSWVHADIAALYDAELAAVGVDRGVRVRADALWPVRNRLRRELVEYTAARTGVRLNPDALTIAFARRFATYKRAALLLADPDRLADVLADRDRPVQLLFAGKAHPRDASGKALIQRIVKLSREPVFNGRLVFLPAYGIDVARRLVQGADVWLNNPRRPLEASGTSGMKAAANGVLNVSVLDGWWDEAWQDAEAQGARIGWAIRPGDAAPTEEAADAADAQALFDVLEQGVVPAFYERDAQGVPGAWVERMAQAIERLAPAFSSHRMVRGYVDRYRRAAETAVGSIG